MIISKIANRLKLETSVSLPILAVFGMTGLAVYYGTRMYKQVSKTLLSSPLDFGNDPQLSSIINHEQYEKDLRKNEE